MVRRISIIFIIALLFVSGLPTAYGAGLVEKKPLDEVFDQMVIVPFDYQGKAFVNGMNADVYGDYEMVQRNGRVLVPIRLMSYLATQSDRYNSYWEAIWQPQKPNEVLLRNNGSPQKTVLFTVGSKTMLINKEPHTMDIAPQKVNGRIVLPLRSAAEALDKKIDWLDGLILIGDEYVDLQSPQTLAVKDRIKALLTDKRKRVENDQLVTPIAAYGESIYFMKSDYSGNVYREYLYLKKLGQKDTRIQLPGTPVLHSARVIDQQLYYVTTVNGQTELHAFSLVDSKTKKIAATKEWLPDDGWLDDVLFLDKELYVSLHTGDNTMGGEALYKVDNGKLTRVVGAKSFAGYAKDGPALFVADFRFMTNMPGNLQRVDTQTGKITSIGDPAFTYAISRTIEPNGGTSYTGGGALFVRDGYLYTLGYREDNLQDEPAVYRINPADQTQTKLTSSASQFWMDENRIYYVDKKTGFMQSADLNGEDRKTLIQRKIISVQMDNGSFYYTVNAQPEATAWDPGVLYRYNVTSGQEVQLSKHSATSFFVGKTGIYYVSKGYEPGLYRVNPDGSSTHLVKDSIETAIQSDAGIAYTLSYKAGVYLTK